MAEYSMTIKSDRLNTSQMSLNQKSIGTDSAQWINAKFDTSFYYSGDQSLVIGRGGSAEIYMTLNAGDHNITVWVYAYSVGGAELHIVDGSGNTITSDSNSNANQWEQLSVDVTTTDWTLYKIKLINSTGVDESSDLRVWFDKVVVL